MVLISLRIQNLSSILSRPLPASPAVNADLVNALMVLSVQALFFSLMVESIRILLKLVWLQRFL